MQGPEAPEAEAPARPPAQGRGTAQGAAARGTPVGDDAAADARRPAESLQRRCQAERQGPPDLLDRLQAAHRRRSRRCRGTAGPARSVRGGFREARNDSKGMFGRLGFRPHGRQRVAHHPGAPAGAVRPTVPSCRFPAHRGRSAGFDRWPPPSGSRFGDIGRSRNPGSTPQRGLAPVPCNIREPQSRCGRAGHHADPNGGTVERAPCTRLSRDSRTSRSTTGAPAPPFSPPRRETLWAPRMNRPRANRTAPPGMPSADAAPNVNANSRDGRGERIHPSSTRR